MNACQFKQLSCKEKLTKGLEREHQKEAFKYTCLNIYKCRPTCQMTLLNCTWYIT